MKRILGKSTIEVSALGMGGWAIGGPWKFDTLEAGWGSVDDNESVRAIQKAIELGVSFFDTAANYGAGHSEQILGRAIAGNQGKVIIATKFGYKVFDQEKLVSGVDASPAAIRQSCEASLRRLGTEHIDLFQFHVGDYPLEQVDEVVETLEALVHEGKIRAYGWSTDDPLRARCFARGTHCTAIQHDQNVLLENPTMLALCEELNLASINRGPLAMGLLSGKYQPGQSLPKDDIRGIGPEWMQYFREGKPNPEWLRRLRAIREVLTSSGRTLAQGALAWLWAKSPNTIPIPGFRTVAQVEENAGAMKYGPLKPEQMAEIERILGA